MTAMTGPAFSIYSLLFYKGNTAVIPRHPSFEIPVFDPNEVGASFYRALRCFALVGSRPSMPMSVYEKRRSDS